MTRHAARPFPAQPGQGPTGVERFRDGRPGQMDPVLLDTVRRSVLAESGPVTDLRVATAVRDSGRLLGAAGSLAAMDRIAAELNGLGPLQHLALDPEVTDIFVNAPNSVWLDRGAGPERAAVDFDGEGSLRALAVRLIAAGGRRLDDSSPCVDVKIAQGYRVHAVLPPISSSGTLLSIRIKRRQVFTIDELQAAGCVHPVMAVVLRKVISARLSFLVSGATGAGKTTLLSTLLGLCDPAERLVLIEDAAELEPDHPHVLTLEARHANTEGAGAIDLEELVRQALRMNPGRLIVGECRGLEVRELLMALNTGHSGGGGTIHANSATDVPARLAALGVLAGMSTDAVALQAASALDAVIHLDRTASGRVVSQLGVVELQGGRLQVVPALHVGDGAGMSDGGRAHSTGGQGARRAAMVLDAGPAWPGLARRLGLDPGLVAVAA
ncbi:TadA family conjugal transfer-associated ATPase [Arthrobacter silviterrae]|uniref:TadA family conjugal transfer-associated ATPase n=2 Tax=Arthrobacter silviterrae TaxID=2026658 RepID=A0ABX0DCU5_9MICC|nr:TadA family conjugal transfer-associated ATPase [Arthrobacter silviterrae]